MSFDPRDPPDPYDRNAGFAGGAPQPSQPPPLRDPYQYRDPLDPNAPGEAAKAAARNRVMAPAIFLIIMGVLNLVSALGCIPMGLICYALPPEMVEAQMKAQHPKEADQIKQSNMSVKDAVNLEGHMWIAGGVAGLLTGVPILIGGIGMLGCRWYYVAILGSVVAMISPAGCGCLFAGFVAGIWSLIVLMSEEVRAAFR
jgi:hypothetical protein